MEAKGIKLLENVIGKTTLLRTTRHFEPKPSMITADYIRQKTVEPIPYAVIGDDHYQIRIFKECISPEDVFLKISLSERKIGNFYRAGSNQYAKVTVSFAFPVRESADFVIKAAGRLRSEYRHEKFTAHKELPNEVPLIEMIATRIEYYMRGGNCSKLENRIN